MIQTEYFQVGSNDISLDVKFQGPELVYDRDFWEDSLIGPVSKSHWIKYWEIGRWYLLVITTVLPFLLYPIEILSKSWLTSLLGLMACCLPSKSRRFMLHSFKHFRWRGSHCRRNSLHPRIAIAWSFIQTSRGILQCYTDVWLRCVHSVELVCEGPRRLHQEFIAYLSSHWNHRIIFSIISSSITR